MFFIFTFLFHYSLHSVHAANVPPPANGLDSNSNYVWQDGGNAITGLTTQINIDHELQTSDTGVSFQLNCWSVPPKTVSDSAFQQFVVGLNETQLFAGVELWIESDPQTGPASVYVREAFLNTTSVTDVIPSGTQFTISLIENEGGTITGANFTLTLNGKHSNFFSNFSQPTRFGVPAMSPIVAFTLNVGGSGYGETGQLSGGNGTFQFSSKNPLTPINIVPQGFTNFTTAETSNAVYSAVMNTSGTTSSQNWSVGPDAGSR
jgi:hypothetical protein